MRCSPLHRFTPGGRDFLAHADPLREIAQQHPAVSIGSYPADDVLPAGDRPKHKVLDTIVHPAIVCASMLGADVLQPAGVSEF